MTIKFQTYQRYKPSGIDWLGDIPTDWDIEPLLNFAHKNYKRNLGGANDELLSLSYGRVVKKEKIDGGLLPVSFSTYQVVETGDIVMRLTDLQNDHVSLRTGLVTIPGIITSAYLGLEIRKERINEGFCTGCFILTTY